MTLAERLAARVLRLPNGLTVVVQTDRTAPLVAVSLTYRVGSCDEEPGKAGLAHLFEHLMFQGTERLPPNAISRLVEESGGTDNAFTMKTNTTYHEVVPSESLEAVLWAEADRMRGLSLAEREFEVEKKVVLEELAQTYRNQPYRRALDAEMGELAFARWENSHPVIGVEEDLRAATLADARAFYDRHYSPANAVLALAGDVTVSEARRLAARHFGPLPRGRSFRRRGLEEPAPREARRRRVEDPLAKVPLLAVAWRLPPRRAPDYWPLAALSAALSGGEDAPLHQELVKRRRLAVSVGTHMPYFNGHTNARGPDLMGVLVTLKEGAESGAALDGLEAVLARVRREGPTEEELSRAKVAAERAWAEGQLSLAERAQTLSSYAAFIGAPSGFWRDLGRFLKVTRRQAALAARRWLASDRRLALEIVPGPGAASGEGPDAGAPAAAEPPAAAASPESAPPRPAARPPAPRRAGRLRLPPLERFRLPEGLEVVLSPDRRLPLVEARLALRAGRCHEARGEEGLAWACEELLFKGCEGLDAPGVARAFSSLGWSATAAGETEWLKVSASGLSRGLEGALSLLARILRTPSFPEAEAELWRENAVEELKARRAAAAFLADERLRAELFPGHPYGRPHPDEAAAAAVDSSRLRAFHAARLRAAGGHLVLAGDFDPEAARRALERELSGWGAGAAPADAPPPPDHGAARTVLVDRPGSAQAVLHTAQPLSTGPRDPDYMSLVLAVHVLGGTANSRLFENLRTRRGYTYGAYSSLDPHRAATVWSASADVRPDAARESLREIAAEVARLREELVAGEALAASKRHMNGLYLMRLSSPDRLAGHLGAVLETGRDPREALAGYAARLAAVTPASLREAARARLDPSRFVSVVVGEAAVLRGRL